MPLGKTSVQENELIRAAEFLPAFVAGQASRESSAADPANLFPEPAAADVEHRLDFDHFFFLAALGLLFAFSFVARASGTPQRSATAFSS